MKITKRQLKRIIKEEKAKILQEMNHDGTISDAEEEERLGLIMHVQAEIDNLLRHIDKEAERIGGGFRAPGIRREALRALADEIHRAR